MSEYQYYEFRAVDHRLSLQQMDELRQVSSRGEITPTSFTNHYTFGSFKGSPLEWMKEYFDVFYYCANWGSYSFMLRLPEAILDRDTVTPYIADGFLDVHCDRGYTILHFHVAKEEYEEIWDAERKLMDLLSIRTELQHGDLRALYLGWLLAVQHEHFDWDCPEPPVPDGLGELSAAQQAFVDLFEIDHGLIDEASKASAPLHERSKSEALGWLGGLSEDEKDELLRDVVTVHYGMMGTAYTKLVHRHLAEVKSHVKPRKGQRCIEQLLKAAGLPGVL